MKVCSIADLRKRGTNDREIVVKAFAALDSDRVLVKGLQWARAIWGKVPQKLHYFFPHSHSSVRRPDFIAAI